MKYAVLADIHANLPALEAVLADSRTQQCTHYVCLGDVVGYGGSPRECLKVVREMGMPCVKGNHDDYCASDQPLTHFTSAAAKVIAWTRTQLSDEDRQWLGRLKYIEMVEGFTLVHATLDSPHRWCYAFNKLDAAAHFPHQETAVCFFGHTHVPMAFVKTASLGGSPSVNGRTYSKFRIDAQDKYFVNPGSVGQPRDHDSKSAYAICDFDKQTIELRRVVYDVDAAVKNLPKWN